MDLVQQVLFDCIPAFHTSDTLICHCQSENLNM